MKLRSVVALVAVTALAGACTPDQSTAPSDRSAPGALDSVIVLAPSTSCAAVPATIRTTIITLFLNAGFGSSSAAVTQFNLIVSLLAANDVAGAQAQAKDLANKLLARYEALPPVRKLIAKPLTLLIIKQLYCLVGMNGVVFDLNPGDPAKAFVTQNGQSGVWFPPNVVAQGTIVTITEIPAGSNPLLTPLDRWPTFLEVVKSPNLPLNLTNGKPVVGVCLPATTPLQVALRLLVGHQQKGPTGADLGFELLDAQPIPSALDALLNCPTILSQGPEVAPKTWLGRMVARVADALLPAKVQARPMLALGRIGGSAGTFSPFGGVDPSLKAVGRVGGSAGTFSPGISSGPALTAPPAATITGYQGTTTLISVPVVTITTEGNPTPNPIPGVTVTFTITSGTATFCDGVTTVAVQSDIAGVARPDCLDFGGTPGLSTISATFNTASLNFPGSNLVVVNQGQSKAWDVVTLAPALPINFSSPDYKYLPGIDAQPFGTDNRAGQVGDAVPEGWQTPGFNDAGWTTARMPFVQSSEDASCGLTTVGVQGDHTTWSLLTDLLVRRSFSTSAPGTVQIEIYIDNDVQVYLDGVQVSEAPYLTPTDLINPAMPGWAIHDGCADGGANSENAPPAETPSGYPKISVANVAAGNHTIAVRAHDYSGSTYLDMKVTFVTPAP